MSQAPSRPHVALTLVVPGRMMKPGLQTINTDSPNVLLPSFSIVARDMAAGSGHSAPNRAQLIVTLEEDQNFDATE